MKKIFFCFLLIYFVDHLFSQEYICEKDQACFKGVNDKIELFTNITDIKLTNYSSLIIFSRKPPLEFINNTIGNPFPLAHIDIYLNEKLIDTRLFLFLYKVGNKTHQKSSFLEGNNKYKNLTFVSLLKDTELNLNGVFKTTFKDENSYFKHFDVEFYVNDYIDLFSNIFDVKIREKILSYKGDTENIYQPLIDLYHYQLKDYYDICNEVRMYDGTNAEDYRMKFLEESKDRDIEIDMDIVKWLHHVNKIDELGSICTSIKGDVKKEIDCINENKDGCSVLIKIEKLKDNFYQFHFFINNEISYLRISFSTTDNFKVKYEIVCDRYSNETKHYLVSEDKKNVNNFIESFNGTSGLIYSLTKFMYCGFFLPINKQFDLLDESFEFKLNDKTIIEVEAGVFHEDEFQQERKIKKWYHQFNLELTFANNLPEDDFYKFIIIILVFIISILCIIVAYCILKKYQNLSRKLTEVGSRFSNLNIASNFSGASGVSGLSNISTSSNISTKTNSSSKNSNLKLNSNVNLSKTDENDKKISDKKEVEDKKKSDV